LLFTLVSLSTSRTIQWTNAGGTPLWDFALNWDCNCIPTISDDVVINVANIQGSVRIGGNPGFANSLTVGGNSQFPQSLIVQGALTIGAGGAKILPNGAITLDTAPSSPLSCSGVFQGASNFFFKSGSLYGTGSFVFHNLNFTGPALHVINATTTVDVLQVIPGEGSQGAVEIGSKQLVVNTNLFSSATLTISSDPGASLLVKGAIQYQGSSGVTSVTIRGDATIATLAISGGTVTLSDDVNVASATVRRGLC